VSGRGEPSGDLRLGIADHLGWATAVTACEDHEVVDRRRIAITGPGVSAAPLHYEKAGTATRVEPPARG
jgi:hypothetical protein